MKRGLCIALLALTGCPGAASVIEDVPEDLKKTASVVPAVADRWRFADPSAVEAGRWAKYREGERAFTLAVVAHAPEGTWMEVVEDGAASARLVAPDGAVRKAYYQETGGPAREQPLEQRAEPPAPKLTETSRETGEEKIAVGGRELAAKVLRLRLEDLEGRLTTETWAWHPDVPPLFAGGDAGGLVRRETAAGKVVLLDFGAGAKPAVQRP